MPITFKVNELVFNTSTKRYIRITRIDNDFGAFYFNAVKVIINNKEIDIEHKIGFSSIEKVGFFRTVWENFKHSFKKKNTDMSGYMNIFVLALLFQVPAIDWLLKQINVQMNGAQSLNLSIMFIVFNFFIYYRYGYKE
jgi:hypothetical protein